VDAFILKALLPSFAGSSPAAPARTAAGALFIHSRAAAYFIAVNAFILKARYTGGAFHPALSRP